MGKGRINRLIEKFDWRCRYCTQDVETHSHQHPRNASADHYIPIARGGGEGENLVLSCKACNDAKSDMTGDEFLEFIQTNRLPESYIIYLSEKTFRVMHQKPRQEWAVRRVSTPQVDFP